MKLKVLPDIERVAQQAVKIITRVAQERIQQSGQFSFAVSGGSTPWIMLRQLAISNLDWGKVALFQTDERIVPAGDPQRNLVQIKQQLLDHSALKQDQIFAMPVEQTDLESAARDYSQELHKRCGNPPILDLIHLGLGEDGHTASLLPGDSALTSHETIAISNEYQGLRRMTMTYSVINAARHRLWIVTGAKKRAMLERLYHGDRSIPAGRVERDNAIILADEDVVGGLNL